MTDSEPTSAAGRPSAAPSPRQPNTLRTVLLVLGSIVLAIILVNTALWLVHSLNADRAPGGSGRYAISGPFDSVELHSNTSDVDVVYKNVDEPQLRFDQGGTQLRLDREVSNGVLRITVDRQGWGWWGMDWSPWSSATLQLVLPQQLAGDSVALTIDSTAGNLNVVGDFGAVVIESTAGDVRLKGSASALDVTTTAGDVRLKEYTVSGTFRSDSTAGDGTFEFRTLPQGMDVRATAGDIRVTIPSGDYQIETVTTVGEVSQSVSSTLDSDRVYRFETTAGDIDVNEG